MRKCGAAGSLAASRASGANAGRHSEGLRTEGGFGGGGSVGPGDSGVAGALCGARRGSVPRPREQARGPGVYCTHEPRGICSKVVVIFWAVPSNSLVVANPAGL